MMDFEKEFKRFALGRIFNSSFSILFNIFCKKTCSSGLRDFSWSILIVETNSLITVSNRWLTSLKSREENLFLFNSSNLFKFKLNLSAV